MGAGLGHVALGLWRRHARRPESFNREMFDPGFNGLLRWRKACGLQKANKPLIS